MVRTQFYRNYEPRRQQGRRVPKKLQENIKIVFNKLKKNIKKYLIFFKKIKKEGHKKITKILNKLKNLKSNLKKLLIWKLFPLRVICFKKIKDSPIHMSSTSLFKNLYTKCRTLIHISTLSHKL